MGLNKIHNISICNDGLDYGINIDNHFYIRNHIISRPSIRDSDDEQKFIAQLGDSVQRSMVQTEGGRWAASARQKSVEDLCALIRRYFKESENKFINHAWQTLIRTLLNNSRTEQPNYDFKQGGDAANLLI